MKLSIKLPLTFASVLALMLAAALYGIYSLNQSLTTYETTVQTSNGNVHAVAELTVAFKLQVQEWKNALLRGKKPADLDKHWRAFGEKELAVSQGAKKLLAVLPDAESRLLLSKFAEAHARMGESYRKAFEAFKSAGFDPTVGDVAVHGMDREPVKLLDEAGEKIAADSSIVSTRAAADGKRATAFSLVMMLLASVVGIAAGVLISRSVVRQLGGEPADAASVARSVAAGDLSVSIEVKQGDTTSLMAQLRIMQDSLARVVDDVRQNSEMVATASAQIAQGNDDLSQRTDEQASALQQTAATMDELGVTVRNNADNALQANQLALGASSVAARGGEVVGHVVDTMKGISDSSRKIAEIISVIDGIAFQTNILALNAAVEAARAGDQGRGFAVVASEVRNLAQRSASAAKEIKDLISTSVERVENGTALVNQAGKTMREIVGAIKRVVDIVGEISAASAEQSAGVSQVGQAVTQMDQATQQNAALVEESAAAAESLKGRAQQLVQAVAVFKLPPVGIRAVPVASGA
jgi:methyl-accepting chemotaxis protein-1 (serine sensor receptor)